MPDPQRLLTTLRRAAALCRATPGRKGRVVSVDGEVFVTGDLHGNLENFSRLLQIADLAGHPDRHFLVQELIHGTTRYPDGSDRSHQLLDLVAALKCQYPRQVHYLLGNHELAQALERPIGKGDEVLNQLFREGVVAAYHNHAEEVYAAYLDLFAAVPLAVTTLNRVFLSHSLPPPKWRDGFKRPVLEMDVTPDPELRVGGTVHGLVWGRDLTAENVTAFLALVDADWLVTGHIPCDAGHDFPNDHQVILDSMKRPAGYALLPADVPLTRDSLRACVKTLE